MIHVQQTGRDNPFTFSVMVEEKGGQTHHEVTMSRSTYEKLAGGKVSEARCIEAAFEFLLQREPKESILPRFDVTVISKYFPSFNRDLANYL